MDTMWQDLRYGLRMLAKTPAFTTVAVIALALGIGANSAIFSVVDAILIKPLPYKDPGGLVMVWESNPHRGHARNVVSPGNFLDWQVQNTVFEQMAALRDARLNLIGAGEPEELRGQAVSANLFPMLGVNAMLGRTFSPEEDLPDRPPVVLLSQRLWERRFGGDSNIVGRSVNLGGNIHTVIGVMARGFQFLSNSAEFWVPFGLDKSRDYRKTSGRYMVAAARLKTGVGLTQARSEMSDIAKQLEQDYPEFDKGWGVNVISLEEQISGDLRPALLVMLAAVGFVLLIACANVANLLLARATSRQREIAIRTSLGAGPWRLIRQLLTESVLLGILGGALGLLLAQWGVRALVALAPRNTPRLDEITLDLRVLGFTFLIACATGVLFGLAPALLATRTNPNKSLKEGARPGAGSGRARMLPNSLVALEVALSLVLLIGSGLLIRSFVQLTGVNPGFQPENLLTARVLLPGSQYDGRKRVDFFQRALQRIEPLPGVRAASAISFLPFGDLRSATGFTIQDRPEPAPGQRPVTDVRVVHPNYFRTMGTPLLKGRDFDRRDTPDSPRVFVINQALARKYWPDEDPIGKKISVAMDDENPYGEIIGIVADVKDQKLDADVLPTVFYPHAHLQMSIMSVVVRIAGDPAPVAQALTQVIRSLDPNQPVAEVRLMEEVISASVLRQRFNMVLLAVFAGTALVLAAVGIYGVMSFFVTQRTHEMGIRMALGARRGDVLGLVLRQGMAVALIGVALGLSGAFVMTRALSSLLFSVKATDPITFSGVSLLLALVALAAIYFPARRATKVDPMIALRYE